MDAQNPTQPPPVNPIPSVGTPPVVEIIPPQVDQPQTPPSGKFSLSPKIMLIILAILIVAVVGSGIYLSAGTQPKPTPTPTPTIVSKPTPTPDPTTNWKKYTNPTYNFVIKYPSTLSLEDKTSQFPPFTIFITDKSKQVPYEGGNTINPYMIIQVKKSNLSTNDYINDPNNNLQLISNKKVGGNDFVIAKEKFGIGIAPDIYMIKNSNSIISISNSSYSIKSSFFDQILSTFKFTDQKQSLSEQEVLEIKNQIFKRDGIPLNEIVFSIDEPGDATLASGSVGRTNEAGGGKWFATKINNQWKVVWTGNGLPKCSEIAQYYLPKEFLNCY